jgi:hypothetical protein
VIDKEKKRDFIYFQCLFSVKCFARLFLPIIN